MHPLYHSSRWAQNLPWHGIAIQHHFAHALSVMAEHGLEEVIALTFDGTGYGTDGTVWGGEFLHATRQSFTRLGSFAPFALPGGEAAVLNPARIAFALLAESRAPESMKGAGIPGIDARQGELLRAMLDRGVNCPVTTSLGRVFDAAAAILGLVEQVTYEGEGPIRLEGFGLSAFTPGNSGLAEKQAAALLPFLPSTGDERLFLIDPRPLLSHLLTERKARAVPALSLVFHEAIARASLQGARKLRSATGISRIALSGGVFQNLLLRELLVPLLIKEGFEVFLNVQVPPGDGGLSVGQAWFQES